MGGLLLIKNLAYMICLVVIVLGLFKWSDFSNEFYPESLMFQEEKKQGTVIVRGEVIYNQKRLIDFYNIWKNDGTGSINIAKFNGDKCYKYIEVSLYNGKITAMEYDEDYFDIFTMQRKETGYSYDNYDAIKVYENNSKKTITYKLIDTSNSNVTLNLVTFKK
jgi:hypothetical protein